MRYTVTPHSMTRATLTADPMASLARGGRHIVQPLSGYDVRPAIDTEARDEHDACEEAWMRYQNIDEDHQTPDRKRSLMTGDMASVTDESGSTTWWIVCSFGWSQTVAPGDVRVEVSKPEESEED